MRGIIKFDRKHHIHRIPVAYDEVDMLRGDLVEADAPLLSTVVYIEDIRETDFGESPERRIER